MVQLANEKGWCKIATMHFVESKAAYANGQTIYQKWSLVNLNKLQTVTILCEGFSTRTLYSIFIAIYPFHKLI